MANRRGTGRDKTREKIATGNNVDDLREKVGGSENRNGENRPTLQGKLREIILH